MKSTNNVIRHSKTFGDGGVEQNRELKKILYEHF
jgi:hypothetical protein